MLLATAVGVPLIVHVLLSMNNPGGSPGETVQVAPLTPDMPPLEPLPEPLPESENPPTIGQDSCKDP